MGEPANVDVSALAASLVYALDNPLYDRFAEAILHNRVDVTTFPRLRDMASSRLQETPLLEVEQHHYYYKDVSPKSSSNSNNIPQERPPDAVTLRWNLGLVSFGNSKHEKETPLVADEHAILVLMCGTDDSHLVILDAATVPQARATHQNTVCHRKMLLTQQQLEPGITILVLRCLNSFNHNPLITRLSWWIL